MTTPENWSSFIKIRHPSCSSDLTISDFWLFDLVTSCLDSQTIKSQKFQIIMVLKNIPKEEYKQILLNGINESNIVKKSLFTIL